MHEMTMPQTQMTATEDVVDPRLGLTAPPAPSTGTADSAGSMPSGHCGNVDGGPVRTPTAPLDGSGERTPMIQRERTSALRDRGPEIAPLLGVVPPSAMTRDDGHHSLPAGVDDESCLELPLASSPGVILKIEKGRASGHTRVLHEPAAAMQPCSVCDCSSDDLPEVSYHWICQH